MDTHSHVCSLSWEKVWELNDSACPLHHIPNSKLLLPFGNETILGSPILAFYLTPNLTIVNLFLTLPSRFNTHVAYLWLGHSLEAQFSVIGEDTVQMVCVWLCSQDDNLVTLPPP